MDMEILRQLIKRKKARGLMLDEEKPEDDEKEDGLSPKLKVEVEAEKEVPLEDAEEILGRKPMSLAKGDDGEDEGGLDESALDSDVLEAMKDARVLEALEDGKKPKKLWERVQANIAKMKK